MSQDQKFDIQKIKVIVGLGNDGKTYINTRHNAGFIFLDLISQHEFSEDRRFESYLSKRYVNGGSVLLSKPTTLMNLSGRAVQKLLTYFDFDPSELLVVHDDLDIDLGSSKIQFAKGPKVHNGINNIVQMIGTDQFWRLRIGVDDRDEESRVHMPPSTYVLSRFSQNELMTLKEHFRILKEDLFAN